MRHSCLLLAVSLALPPAFTACGGGGSKTPDRDALVAQLTQEAEALKRENDNKDAALGVKATWNIESVDVTQTPNDPKNPWAGTVVFRIRSETQDMDGKVAVDESQKRFDYVYNATLQKWVFDYKP